jgi:tripartite-type tricarboxylate transporter receptor subunit TctC
MKPSHRKQFLYLAAGALTITLIAPLSGWSQAPRSINLVVPFNPGGPQDTVARIVGQQVARAQNRSIVIENRPGAATTIGTEAVSHATPDGSTLLENGDVLFQTPFFRKVGYDPLTAFLPICILARFLPIVVVNNESTYHTLADLLEAARAKPADLTFATFGPATAEQVSFEMLKRSANVNMTFVPYPGYAPAVAVLLGGHVTVALVDYSASAQQLASGQLRALATLSRSRITALPQVPTIAELGYKGIQSEHWSGVFAPAKTPKETISQLVTWFEAAIQNAEIRARLAEQGFEPVGICGDEAKLMMSKEFEDFGRIMGELNLRPE